MTYPPCPANDTSPMSAMRRVGTPANDVIAALCSAAGKADGGMMAYEFEEVPYV
ncbi:MAG: hypothetical protein JKP92_08030 [Alphaproteobacteria bacterium]|jgi:hypothetical protein|nr:hypothetical protein [Alphaproteobacteria bacterium]